MEKLYESNELAALLEVIGQKYEVRFEPVRVADKTIEVLQIADMATYVDTLVETTRGQVELPFWAKVWPSSLLLSFYLSRLPAKGRSVLEIGAGVGVAGLYAAMHGFDVVISDIVEDSLLFARANVLKNGLEAKARVARVDFGQDRLDDRFDLVLGCEVVYIEDMDRPLVKFLLRHLKAAPEAEVVLAMSYKRKARKFFQLADKEFFVDTKVIGCKATPGEGEAKAEADDERHLCSIHRLKPKKQL